MTTSTIIKTVSDLADHLGIHRKTAWLKIKNGYLPKPILTPTGKKVGWTDEYLSEYQNQLESRAIKALSA